jgi:hypothetical protein
VILQEFLSGYFLRPNVPPNDGVQRHGNRSVLNAFMIPFFCEGKLPLELSVVGIAAAEDVVAHPIEPACVRKFICAAGNSFHQNGTPGLYVDLSDSLIGGRIVKR